MLTDCVAIDRLAPHPSNSNVMPRRLRLRLKRHIERTGRYPPIIVRAMDDEAGEAGGYQIIDGHHRVQVLRELGYGEVDCVVWALDDDEALLLLATLNRLEGRDDPFKRAALIGSLSQARDMKELADLLPERGAELSGLLALRQPPPAPRPPRSLDEMPVAVHFFLKPAERQRLEARLKEVGPTREAALMTLVGKTNAWPTELQND